MNFIDAFLNRITMYRLVLYYLIILHVVAFILSLTGILALNPWALAATSLFLVGICLLSNFIFAKIFRVSANNESAYISALILALLVAPQFTTETFVVLAWIGVVAMATKYILVLNKKHLFNPAAIAGVILALSLNQSFIWWVGTASLLPVILLVGLLIVRKIRRFDMFASFLVTALLVIASFGLSRGTPLDSLLQRVLLNSPLIFFATLMLTEPLTTPPSRWGQIAYGALVGALFSPQVHLLNVYSTPELALILGNIFAYAISPKQRLILTLKEKITMGGGQFDYVFTPDQKIAYQPGQYMEWTLPIAHGDSRGNRRFFTLASSPTENTIRLGVKFYDRPSSFKQTLSTLELGNSATASQLAGNFILPRDPNQKCVLIAGGIGVTPYRSQIKYLLDSKQKRDIVLMYSNNTVEEIAYADVFSAAAQAFSLRTIYTLTDKASIPTNWQGKTGFIDKAMVAETVPDYKERKFYISGPHAMVVAIEKQLAQLGVPRRQIKTDYFPGYA